MNWLVEDEQVLDGSRAGRSQFTIEFAALTV